LTARRPSASSRIPPRAPFAIDDLFERYEHAVAAGGWHESTADHPWPWLGHLASVIANANAVFADRAAGPKRMPWTP